MEYEMKLEQEWLWVGLPTEIDHFQAEQIRQAIKAKMQEGYVKYVVFDFEKTSLMDSSGIGLIAGRYRELAVRGGQVYVSHVSNSMKKVLTISGLYRIVTPWEQVLADPEAEPLVDGMQEAQADFVTEMKSM